MKLSSKTKILIATFSPWKNGKRLPINGNLEPMIDYFTNRINKTILIDQVYPGGDFVMPRIEIYNKNKLHKIEGMSWFYYFLCPFLKISSKPGTHISFKIRDLLSVIDIGLRNDEKFDFFIGFEAINAIGGILLRKLGRVGKVIYYVSDYSPHRYKSKWFNDLYLWLDRVAFKYSDYIWDVSPAMLPARLKAGLSKSIKKPVLVVPNALYPVQIKSEKINKLEPYSIVFMGTLGKENGPDLAIKALSLVVKKYNNAKLHIIGGERENELQKLSKKLKVSKNIIFHGFIADRELVSREIRKYMIGLAPYVFFKGSARLYGDATKIRAYLAAGLPVITTQVPPLGREIEERGAGIIVRDKSEEIAKVILDLFKDNKRYIEIRNNAIKFAQDNTWDKEFDKAFVQMEKIEKNL